MNVLALSQLRVWPGNPRKTINEDALAELATSIRDQGLLQPVVVRSLTSPIDDVTHEVIDGQRRYLAAKLAQLVELPVVVRDLDDQQALEIALAANTAREEAEPLEEAEALEALVKSGRAPHKIAERLGRSLQWVERRRKLLGLCEEARAFAREKKLSFAHMLALSMVDTSVQKEVLVQFKETRLFPPAWQFARQVLYRLRRIENAPFDPKDATLGGEGACTKCVYRSDTQGDLFDSDPEDVACLRPECWNAKADANWERAAKDAKKRKLKVFGDHKEVFVHGEQPRNEALYSTRIPEGTNLSPIAIGRTASGKPVDLYDATAAAAAWDALDAKDDEDDESEDSDESEQPQGREPKKNRADTYAEDRAKRRAKSAERLNRVAKMLEDVDGLERLALGVLQDEFFVMEIAPEVLQAAGVVPVLGKQGIQAHNALTVLALTIVWDRLRDEQYSNSNEAEESIAKLLGNEPPKEDLAAKLTASIEESKSARDMGDVWKCIATIDPESDEVSQKQIAELTAAWKEKAGRIGLSTATLKTMANDGKGPAIEKKPAKRTKKSKTAEATS